MPLERPSSNSDITGVRVDATWNPKPPTRPKSARLTDPRRSNGLGKPPASPRQAPAATQPIPLRLLSNSHHSNDGLVTKSVERFPSLDRYTASCSAFGTSSRGRRCGSNPPGCHYQACQDGQGDEKCPQGFEVVSALMYSVLHTFELREDEDLWTKLLTPLRALVPCEDVKVVVRCLGAPPLEAATIGPFDPTIKNRVKKVTFVEHWCDKRIDGQAALTQRMQKIPSQENNRHHWDQYEVAKSQIDSLRCMIAIPLFDADSNVLAVLKFVNRCTQDGLPILEFSKADQITLSAFGAIFTCLLPHPYLGMPGACLQRRPQARITLSDRAIGAIVSWQVPMEIRGMMVHEIRYGEVDQEDEYAGHLPQDDWVLLPCGLLESRGGPEDLETNFEYMVPVLQTDTSYAFSVRLRNQRTALEWSEPSMKLSTFLAPPHSMSGEVQRTPVGGGGVPDSVEVEWNRFDTCDPSNLQLIEYRVVAIVHRGDFPSECPTQRASQSRGAKPSGVEDEQVVAVFISDGRNARESVTVSCLQPNLTYSFAVEARYPYVGTCEFTRILVSEDFTLPTIDITLPAPQPVCSDLVKQRTSDIIIDAVNPITDPILIRWPYPSDLLPQLVLQYRVAIMVDGNFEQAARTSGRIALHTSNWVTIRASDCLHAQLVSDGAASNVRVLCDRNLEGNLAVQLRVIKGTSASPPSVWFHPQPPMPPHQVVANCISSDEKGSAIQIVWLGHSDRVFDNDDDGLGTREFGPISYAVHHDFSRGNGTFSTRFQLRLRGLTGAGEPCESWEELAPQLLPARCRNLPDHMMRLLGSSATSLLCYQWLLHEQRWFTRPGAAFEVQLRQGNDLFWSSWVPANIVQVQFDAPKPSLGDTLRMLDVRHDSVRLTWKPFTSSEDGLRALEYRILCKELPDNSETSLEVGRSLVSWRTIDAIDAEGSSDMSPLQYTVRALTPERRYKFAVECRYLSLPPALAAEPAFVCRLETLDILPARTLQVHIEPGSISAAADLAQCVGNQSIVQQSGFVLQIRWRFHASSPQATLPGMFCYQLRCLNEYAKIGQEFALLPPALLCERVKSDGVGCFTVDSARVMTADVELCSGAVSAIKETNLRFGVRIGEFASGRVIWSDWSESLSDPVVLALPPPVPVGSTLSLSEQLWGISAENLLPQTAQHSVEAVTLLWSPFSPAELALEKHVQLIVQYEVICWAVNASASSLEKVRRDLSANAASANDVHDVFRQKVRTSHGENQHWLRVPGDCMRPMNFHFFEVKAAYLFASGDVVPQLPGVRTQSLVSQEPYRPTSRQLAAPELEHYIPPHDESQQSCVFLGLPQIDRGAFDPEPVSIEYREGAVYAGRPENEPTVVASGEWTPVSENLIERLPGEKPRAFIRQLKAQICQFRFIRGRGTSEPSLWTDTSVWVPEPLSGSQLHLQMRRSPDATFSCLRGGAGRLQGLGIALGVGRENLLFARLAWPRHAQPSSAIVLLRYQLRYRCEGQDWCVLPIVELPSLDADCAEAVVSDLRKGISYEFSLRLCNALGRWSEWSQQAVHLHLDLPPPAPSQGLERNVALRVNSITPSCARLSWRPFSIARRCDEPPLWIDDPSESRSAISGEYELVVCEESGQEVRHLQFQRPVLFDELPLEEEFPCIEETLQVEPHKGYIFKLRARLRTGAWGPMLESAALPPRLMPIGVTTPLVDLVLKQSDVEAGALDAMLYFGTTVSGFARGQVHDTIPGNHGADRLVAALSQYQIRSSSVESHGESWSEWTPVNAVAAHDPVERTINVAVAVRAVTALAPNTRYTFSIRCCDTYGRWSEWSGSSDPIALRVPPLVPALIEDAQGPGTNLRMTALGPTAVRLEWEGFRADWDTTIPMKALDAALQRVEYRLSMVKRLAESTAEWTSAPIVELRSERRSKQAMSYSVTELDERFEYVFSVSARWADVPLALGSQSWTREVSSAKLPSRLPELRPPSAPRAEVSASDDGICMLVRWCPSAALRDDSHVPLAGARYQVRYVQLMSNAVHRELELEENMNWQWRQEPPVLEDREHHFGLETICRLYSLLPGHSYIFSVRLGDNHHWSAWSPPSAPIALGVPTPTPSAGDLLEMSLGGANTSATLEWRPFRTFGSLSCVEYKVMALEWPFEFNSTEEGILARLKRVAQDAAAESYHGLPQDLRVERVFNVAGYVTKQCASQGGRLRSTGDRVQWKCDGLKPATSYRFFVCARYACLPSGAMLPPPSVGGSAAEEPKQLQARMWPDEVFSNLFDSVAWEASLSRCGLWSAVMNTAHLPRPVVTPSIEQDARQIGQIGQIAQLLNRSPEFDAERHHTMIRNVEMPPVRNLDGRLVVE